MDLCHCKSLRWIEVHETNSGVQLDNGVACVRKGGECAMAMECHVAYL